MRCLACAVVQALMRPRVNAGALCLTGAASSALTLPVLFRIALLPARSSLGGTERIQSNAMKLRRECRCSGVRSRGTE